MNVQPQVMVVDDDLAMCNFLRAFLAERGYRAITLASAEEAVKRYHAERPAAVILDVVMPGAMDGLQALAAFKIQPYRGRKSPRKAKSDASSPSSAEGDSSS